MDKRQVKKKDALVCSPILAGPAAEYIRTTMETIGGWLSSDEATIFCVVDEMQKMQGVEGWLAELGVWQGRGALLMHFLRRPGEALYAIDIFDLRNEAHSHFNDPEIFLGNCRRLGADKDTTMVKVDTAATPEVLNTALPPGGCRLFHIDGGHEYASVKHDMLFAASVLSDGGVLSCDDVFSNKFPGVTQALIEMLLKNPQLAPFAISQKKVWITTRSHAKIYNAHLAKRFEGVKFRQSKFMDSSTLILSIQVN